MKYTREIKKKRPTKTSKGEREQEIINRKKKSRKKKVIIIGPTRITRENKMRIIVSRHKITRHTGSENDRLKPFAYNNQADKE